MRCSPQEELNRDGPGEEIDGKGCSWGKKQRSGELERGGRRAAAAQLESSVAAWSCTRAYL